MRQALLPLLLPLVGCAVGQTEGRSAMQSATRTDETDETASSHRQVRIELLALDLATCGRCTRTEANLDAAVRSVAGMLREADIEVATEKHVVTFRRRGRTAPPPDVADHPGERQGHRPGPSGEPV